MATPKLLPTGSIAALSDPPASDLFPPCPISALGRHPCRPVPPGSSLPRMQDPGHRFQVPTSQSGSHHRMSSSEAPSQTRALGPGNAGLLLLGLLGPGKTAREAGASEGGGASEEGEGLGASASTSGPFLAPPSLHPAPRSEGIWACALRLCGASTLDPEPRHAGGASVSLTPDTVTGDSRGGRHESTD